MACADRMQVVRVGGGPIARRGMQVSFMAGLLTINLRGEDYV
jgi:hypothetical protein